MDNIRIIFFDIDGTLIVPGSGRLSERTVETLTRLRERGVLLCVATGRAKVSLPDFGAVEFDAYITYNGSYCYDRNGTIYSNPVSAEDVKTVIRNAGAIGRPVSVAARDCLAANGWDVDLADYYALAGLELEVAEDFDRVAGQDIYQIMLGCTGEERTAVMRGVRHCKIAVSWDRAVDIIPADGGKGAAVEKLLEFYGLDRSQAMAFGDQYNDIEMLQAVGTGIAMGNASQTLKDIADDVCADVTQDGIYYYCLKHGLI